MRSTSSNAGGTLPVNISMSALSVQEHTRRLNALRKMLLWRRLGKGIFFPRACTPVRLGKMHPWLDLYPNSERAHALIEGFSQGFPLPPPFTGVGCTVVTNLKLVATFPQVVRDKVWKEIAKGRVEGPFRDPPRSGILDCRHWGWFLKRNIILSALFITCLS